MEGDVKFYFFWECTRTGTHFMVDSHEDVRMCPVCVPPPPAMWVIAEGAVSKKDWSAFERAYLTFVPFRKPVAPPPIPVHEDDSQNGHLKRTK